ncbi:hypothetical protein MMC28_010241 [Mycoblastus sanguinarius]|nr:hypothetical protein [Mycoblastus sanguinarius]
MSLHFFHSKHCLRFIALSVLSIQAVQALISLPEPSGRLGVVVTTMELVDYTRTLNPFAPDNRPRAIMVSLFHPVEKSASCVINYMPPATATFEDNEWIGAGFPNGSFEKLGLHVGCTSDSKHSSSSESTNDYPLVLFSPAQGSSRLLYSSLVESVASTGYTVVTIDHPYDVDVVEYPNGTLVVATDVNNDTDQQLDALAEIAIVARALDASFVLDQLTNASIAAQLVSDAQTGLNVSSVAMFGHSLGGATAALAMVNDSRIVGGVNMDGAFFGSVVTEGLDRPFMMMGHDGINQSSYPTWAATWPNLRAWKLEVELANSDHYTFSDFPIVIEMLGLSLNETDITALQVTTLNARRSVDIITAYVTQFLGFVLLGKRSEFLESSKSPFTQVTVDNSTFY